MSRAPLNLVMVLVVIAVVGMVLWWHLIMPRQHELAALDNNIQTYRQRCTQADSMLATANRSGNVGPVRLHVSGTEPQLVKAIYGQAEAANLTIASFSLLETFELPIEQGEMGGAVAAPTPTPAPTQQLPELDANGMPIGASTDADSVQATPLRVLPVQLRVRGTFGAWGKFLAGLEKELTGFRIRRLVQRDVSTDLIDGQIQLVLPVAAEEGSTTGSACNSR